MYRLAFALVVVLLATGTVEANAGPPRGKLVPVEHKITTDKEYPDYTFYLVSDKPTVVKFDPKTPIEIVGKPSEYRSYLFIAVPKGAEKQFDTEKSLLEALIVVDKIKGRVQAKDYVVAAVRVPDPDNRTKIVRESRVEKIDTKDGIVMVTKDLEPKKKDAAAPEKKNSPEDEDAPGATAYTPRGGLWIAGGAVSLSVMLGGLWVAGRTRRKA